MRALLLAALLVPAAVQATESGANPIRRVVTMLQMMQKKVVAEGEAEQKLFDAFECHCKTSDGELEGSIAAAGAKGPQLEAAIKASESQHSQLTIELKQHRADRSAAQATAAQAAKVREDEAAAFAKAKAEHNTNIDGVTRAISALAAGGSGTASFVQTAAARSLHEVVRTSEDMSDADKQDVLAFLSGSQNYAPQGGEVNGILKQLSDDMKAELTDLTAKEEQAMKAYTQLVTAMHKEESALSESIEDKIDRAGKIAVSVATMKNDLASTQESFGEDQKFLGDLKNACASKASEWEERKKTRAEELSALAQTIKILNDDDALELFKHTLPNPSASFLQLRVSAKVLRTEVLRVVRQTPHIDARGPRPELDFIALALQGKKVSFDKVIGMIDAMGVQLKEEQVADDKKKAYCLKMFDETEDQQKIADREAANRDTLIGGLEEKLETVTMESKALEDSMKALDKDVTEATTQRKEENKEFTELMASNTAAKKLLEFAKNRLMQFYNPRLYKPAQERELTKEQRIFENHGGDVPTVAPGGIADTGIAVFTQVAPPPPPETFGAYTTKAEENNGVVAMIDLLIKDLEKEMTEAKVAEDNAQADYETMMRDSAAKRTQDSRALSDKHSVKASLESRLAEQSEAKASEAKLKEEAAQYNKALHAECDWTLQHFDERKEARENEAQQLVDAKSMLKGADFS